MDEEHPTQAKSPYAASKIAQEQLALSYYHTYSLPVKIARPFNTFGPRQSVRAVISVIAKQALMQKGNFNLGNLSPERDWVYVKDTVKGLRLIAEKGTVGEVYNIATEQSRSVQEVVELACSIMNIEPEISADATKVRPGTGEVYKLLGAKEKIGKLGWHPDYSFQEGLTLLIDWLQKKELEIYKAKNILYQ
jgi:dTDP-glucose 4,6-dehydratase